MHLFQLIKKQKTERFIKGQRPSVMKIYPDDIIFAFLCLGEEVEMAFDDFSQDNHVCLIRRVFLKTNLPVCYI